MTDKTYLDTKKKSYPSAELVRMSINASLKLLDIVPRIGKPRSLAATEQATTWREITTVEGTKFRVLTLEDGQ